MGAGQSRQQNCRKLEMDLILKVAAMLSFIETAMWECRPALSRTVDLSCYMAESNTTLRDEWIRKLWYIYPMEYYPAIKKNTFESVLMRWMKLEPIIQSEVSQKEKHQHSILTHIYGI